MGRASVWLGALPALHMLVTFEASPVYAQDYQPPGYDYEADAPAPSRSEPSDFNSEPGSNASGGDLPGDNGPEGPTAPAQPADSASSNPPSDRDDPNAPEVPRLTQPSAAAASLQSPQQAASSRASATVPATAEPAGAEAAARLHQEHQEPEEQPMPASAHWGSTRVLGDHNFLLGTFVPSGLVNSHLGIRAGLEYHAVQGLVQLPSIGESGPQVVDLRTINVAETIDFAVRLHDHFSIFGEGYGKARVGANINTLLGTGADYTYGGNLGLLVKLFHLYSFQMSVRGQAGYYSGQSAGILALFQDLNAIANDAVAEVQANPVIDPNRAVQQLNTAFRTATLDLLTPFEGFTYGIALTLTQALGRYVGLQGSVGYYAESATYRPTRYDSASGGPVTQEHTVVTQRPSFGLAADFDASPAGLPLAVLLEYRATPTSVRDTQAVTQLDTSSMEQLVALGLFYSGRRDLQLGFTTYSVYGRLPTLSTDAMTSDKPLDIAIQLVFRYFW